MSPSTLILWTDANFLFPDTVDPVAFVIVSVIWLPNSSSPVIVKLTEAELLSLVIWISLSSSDASSWVIVKFLLELTKSSPVDITSWLLFVITFKPAVVSLGIGVVKTTGSKSSPVFCKE